MWPPVKMSLTPPHYSEKLPAFYFPFQITPHCTSRADSWEIRHTVHCLRNSPGDRTPAVQRPETFSRPWTTDALSTTQWIPWSQAIINDKKTPLPFQGNYLHTRSLFCNFLQFCFSIREISQGPLLRLRLGVFWGHRSSSFHDLQASASVPTSSPSCCFSRIQEDPLDNLQYQHHVHKWRKR